MEDELIDDNFVTHTKVRTADRVDKGDDGLVKSLLKRGVRWC